jgi:hypothetical protein
MARKLILTLSAMVLSPALLCAQQVATSSAGSTGERKMYEDIEIMRRILDRKLQGLYARSTLQAPIGYSIGGFNPNLSNAGFGGMVGMQGGGALGIQGGFAGMGGMPHSPLGITYYVQEAHPSLEGVYLRGQGVVYTATLSSLQAPAKAEAPQPVSEWESVRRQLHHEKEDPKRTETGKPPELSDVLLKVLAENMQHFSQMPENESLTIVLTVHGSGRSSTGRKSAGQSAKTTSQPLAAGEGDSAVAAKVRDLELLADLHQKQSRYEEALATLHKALEMNPGPRKAATLYRKQAHCYLALAQDEKARAAVDRSIAALKEAADGKDKPASAAKPSAVALPVKVIISVPKRLLSHPNAAKLTIEDLRSQARVETLTFDGDRR